ncbi:MAG: hypothetical protein RIQ96_1942 [Pseudomonadota bacterium]|jgi:hypothetical protein
MLFTPDFIAQMRLHPAAGVLKACALADARLDTRPGWDAESFDILSEAYAVVSALIEAGLLQVQPPEAPVIGQRLRDNCVALQQYLLQVRRDCVSLAQSERIERIRERARQSLDQAATASTPPAYLFTTADIDSIRAALGRLAPLIAQREPIDARVRLRTERRLQQLQETLNDSMSDFDLFWGLVGELKMVVQYLPQDARAVVQCLTEISALASEAHARALDAPTHAAHAANAASPAALALDSPLPVEPAGDAPQVAT